MASSKLTTVDAQEWLESLQLVGEGWYRQVALAVRAGAHKALGMERREFAQSIGQRMIDPREAIVELYREGHTKEAIADVLGISKNSAHNVLVEEGLIEGTLRAKAITVGATAESEPETVAATEDLQGQIETLTAMVEGEKKKAKEQITDIKKKMSELRKEITEEKRRLQREADALLTKEARERAEKEAEAWAQEQGQKVLAGLSHLVIDSIVGNLEEAASELRLLIEQNSITDKGIEQIDNAHAGFMEEYNVARMSAGVA